jgi:hypothetical protein
MLKKTVQQGRSERRGETYFLYVEPMNDARTPLADFFSILLGGDRCGGVTGSGRRAGQIFGPVVYDGPIEPVAAVDAFPTV